MNQIATQNQTGKQVSPANELRSTLDRMMPQMKMALPKHLTPERLVRVIMTSVQNNPKLLDCDRNSFLSAVMTCAQLGLEPDGVLGQAYLIPFKTQGQMRCQFIPGYKGLIALARNSGDVTSIQAQAVHANDDFVYRFGLNEALDHTPAAGDRGEITHFYAIAKFKDGGYHWDVMSCSEIEAIRDASQGYSAAKRFARNGVINSPWVSHFSEMGKKTMIRRIAKYLPMDVQKAAFIADSYDRGVAAQLGDSGAVEAFGDTMTIDNEPAPEQIEDDTNTHDPETGEVVDNEDAKSDKKSAKSTKATKATKQAEEAADNSDEQPAQTSADDAFGDMDD